MSRKTLIIVSIIFLILLAGLFIGVYLINQDTQRIAGEVSEPSRSGSFFPFGRSSTEEGSDGSPSRVTIPSNTTDDRQIGSSEGVFSSGLEKRTLVPISGATSIKKQSQEVSRSGLEKITLEKQFVRYVERATGHIYEIDMRSGNKERISNTTIPATQEIYWDDTGNEIVMRYLDENEVIKSFAGNTGPSVGERLAGVFLPDNISEVAVAPNGEKIFYLENFGASILGTIANFDGTKKDQIFDFPFRGWLVHWPSEKTIVLATKPSAAVDGFLYSVNSVSGAMNKILGNITGLTALSSPGMKYVLYSVSEKKSIGTKIYNMGNKSKTEFPIITLPDKCVWSKNTTSKIYCGVPDKFDKGNYPDIWYQGIISFSDNIWGIDVETGALNILAFPKEIVGEEIDIIHPFLTVDEDYLFFTNKKDGTLWSLKITP